MTVVSKASTFWEDAGARWSDDVIVELIGGQPGRLAMDRLDLRPGAFVLDVGCGTARTTVELLGRAAPAGRSVGIDRSETMLNGAQPLMSAGVGLVRGDAQWLPFATGVFDAVFSRFGVMFFDDTVTAFAGLRCALRPGGRLAFVSWRAWEHNDWMRVPAEAAAEELGVPVPQPPDSAPGPFALADADRILELLHAAGFAEVDAVPWEDRILVPTGQVEAFARWSTGHGGIRALVARAGDGCGGRVTSAIAAALLDRAAADGVPLRRGVNIATGVRQAGKT